MSSSDLSFKFQIKCLDQDQRFRSLWILGKSDALVKSENVRELLRILQPPQMRTKPESPATPKNDLNVPNLDLKCIAQDFNVKSPVPADIKQQPNLLYTVLVEMCQYV